MLYHKNFIVMIYESKNFRILLFGCSIINFEPLLREQAQSLRFIYFLTWGLALSKVRSLSPVEHLMWLEPLPLRLNLNTKIDTMDMKFIILARSWKLKLQGKIQDINYVANTRGSKMLFILHCYTHIMNTSTYDQSNH